MELDLGQIKAVAKEITDESLVAELKLVNITHARLGGYNARAYSNELQLAESLRTQSIKGVWRWWIRAILSGAAWEIGVNDTGPIIELTSKIMGYIKSASTLILKLAATSAETEAVLPPRAINVLANLKGKYLSADIKKIFLECGLQIPQKLNRRHFVDTILPPRLGLLVMDEALSVKELDEILQMHKAESLEAHIQIYVRTGIEIVEDEINLAIGALLLALTLQGVGAITRRG
ncbi:MAG: type III-B CRISPR module RAMP protein Cmr1, partial [Nitrososphaeria archaeon]